MNGPLRVRLYGFDGADVNGADGLFFPSVPGDAPIRARPIVVINTANGQRFFAYSGSRSVREDACVFVERPALLLDISGLHGKAIN